MEARVTRFVGGRVLQGKELRSQDFWVLDGKVTDPQPSADETVDVSGHIVAPGFIELQLNGAYGEDFANPACNVENVSKQLIHQGITSYLPTIISSSPELYPELIAHLQPKAIPDGAEILGVHLEGPFITRPGMHNPDHFPSELGSFKDLVKQYSSLDGVRLITLAPELLSDFRVIKECRKKGIVISLGHSNASLEDFEKAVSAGAGMVTHLFNVMPSMHHRKPGLIGGLLTSNIPFNIILDGHHVAQEPVQIAWKMRSDGLMPTTDACPVIGMAAGAYQMGDQTVESDGEQCWLQGSERKVRAGAVATFDSCVKRLYMWTDASQGEALHAASTLPAKLIGVYPKKGALNPGSDADFLLLSDQLDVKAVFISGKRL